MRTMGTATVETGELSQLPAGPILVRLRRLLLTTAGAAAAYSLLSTGSVGTCTDSPNAGGSGTTQVTCANLVMHPSWIVYAAFAVILFVAIGRVARAIVIGALALAAGLIGMAWLFLIPREALTGGGTVIFPFPFSSPELTITHNP